MHPLRGEWFQSSALCPIYTSGLGDSVHSMDPLGGKLE